MPLCVCVGGFFFVVHATVCTGVFLGVVPGQLPSSRTGAGRAVPGLCTDTVRSPEVECGQYSGGALESICISAEYFQDDFTVLLE